MPVEGNILVSTDEMRTAVSAYETQKEIKLDAIAAMKSAVDNMDGSWDGPASEAFMSAFSILYDRMIKNEARMDDAIDELNQLIAQIEENEITNQNLAKGSQSTSESAPTYGG